MDSRFTKGAVHTYKLLSRLHCTSDARTCIMPRVTSIVPAGAASTANASPGAAVEVSAVYYLSIVLTQEAPIRPSYFIVVYQGVTMV